jgi:hypothetical protein
MCLDAGTSDEIVAAANGRALCRFGEWATPTSDEVFPMARKPTLTEQTNAESHAAFKAAVGALGQGVDPQTERRHAVLIDGVPLADRQNEMRKPGTSFYEKSFTEANAIAHLAVTFDLDQQGTVDVLRRATPMPDAELTVDGSTIAFVEQTMVMDQAALRLTLDIEQLNATMRACQDAHVVAAFASGMLNLRFNAIPTAYYLAGLPIDEIAAEISALARTLDRDLRPIKPEKTQYPLLAGLSTFGSYHVGSPTYSPVMVLVDHGRPPLFREALTEQIRKKRATAAGYPPTCRPLWLLLNVDIHFGYNDYGNIACSVIASEAPTEYDRIIIQQLWFPSVIIECSGS